MQNFFFFWGGGGGGANKVHYWRFPSGERFLTTSIEIAVYCRTKVFHRQSRTFEILYFLFYHLSWLRLPLRNILVF